jgi:hypothetical protein
MITQLDNRRGTEHSLLVDDQLAVLNRIDITLDEEQIGTALHWQEARARDIDTMAVFEVLDCSAGRRLELCSKNQHR